MGKGALPPSRPPAEKNQSSRPVLALQPPPVATNRPRVPRGVLASGGCWADFQRKEIEKWNQDKAQQRLYGTKVRRLFGVEVKKTRRGRDKCNEEYAGRRLERCAQGVGA